MRFDRRAPAFLSGLAAFGDRQLWNPFYYQNGRLDEEIDTLYSEMARAMGQRSRLVAHLNLVRSYADLFSELDLPNLASEFLPLSNTAFLYMRWTHFSGNGNQVIAKLFFDILTGKESSKFSTFSIQPNPEHVGVSSLPALAENEISELFLAIDGQRFAQIVEGGSFARSVRGGNGSDASGEMSYLIVRERGGSFAESFIVDLPGRLSAESIVETADGARIATVQKLPGTTNVFHIEVDGMSRRIDYYPVDGHTPFFRIEQDGPLGELHEAGPGTRLLVDGRDVLTLERRKEWFGPRRSLGLVPSNGGKFMRFMVGEDTVVQDLTDGALVHLVLESEDGVVVELPLDRLAENVETLKLNSYNAERPYLAIE